MPEEGDFLRTDSGSCYLIDKIRPPKRGRAVAVFEVTRLGKDAVQFGDPGVWGWRFER